MTSGTLASAVSGATAAAMGVADDSQQYLHALARDQFLCHALADLGSRRVIAADQLDLDARWQILLVCLDGETDALIHLVALLGEKTCIAVDEADLDRLCGRQVAWAHE
jgi:hypothetical protein